MADLGFEPKKSGSQACALNHCTALPSSYLTDEETEVQQVKATCPESDRR